MSLPESAVAGLSLERGAGDQSLVLRIKANGFPVRAVGRQWRMEFWNEARTVKYADAAASPQVADGNVLTLTFTEPELAQLPDAFWGDLLVVLENGRRRYLLRVQGVATGSGILIGEVIPEVSGWLLPDETTFKIDRTITEPGGPYGRLTGVGDPYFDDVTLLLHFDGSNGSTTFVDSSKYAAGVSVNGNAQISASQSVFGGFSGLFDGGGAYLTVADDARWDMPGDFTIECFVYLTAYSASYSGVYGASIVAIYNANGPDMGWIMRIGGTASSYNSVYLFTGFTELTFSASFALNTWYHVAVSRSGTSVRAFVDGIQVGTTIANSNLFTAQNSSPIWIGGLNLVGYRLWLPGYLDELRITKGVARYTANFTPPTAPHPSEVGSGYSPLTETFYRIDRTIAATNMPYSRQLQLDPEFANISLLLHMDGNNGSTTFVDSSYNSLAVTAVGNAQISTAQSKFGGASALFDGSGDYLSVASSSVLDLTGDFTIEFFVYSAIAINGIGFVSRPNGGGISPIRVDVSGSQVRVSVSNDGATFGLIYSGGLPSTSTWTHVAVTREGNNWRTFVGGTQTASQVNSITPFTSTSPMLIGTRLTNSNFFNGSIDELRITKGLARYTANFTPPAVAFPDPPRPGYTPLQETFQRIDRTLVSAALTLNRTATGYGFTTPSPLLAGLLLSISQSNPKKTLVGDNDFASVSLLLHMDGNNGSTTFTDSSGNALTITRAGDPLISTAQSRFGGASGLFDGSDDYLETPSSSLFDFGSYTPFTIECFFRSNAISSFNGGLFSQRSNAVITTFEVMQWANELRLLVGNAALDNWQLVQATNTGVLTDGTWHHVAFVGDGINVRLYVDGIERIFTNQPAWPSANRITYIGRGGDGTANGHLDEVRITKGVARYTANFTPPTLPFANGVATITDPDFASVSCLLHFDGTGGSTTITDSSSNAFAFSAFGNAALTTSSPQFGTACLALDGTDDYVIGPADAKFALGTGDFTVEFWCYLNTVSDNDGLFTFGGVFSGLALSIYLGSWYLTQAGAGGVSLGSATANVWQHVAVVRQSSVIKMYVNGVQQGSNISSTTDFTDNQLKIGYYYSPTYGTAGKIDEFRLTKGVARYTANFTPPTEAFPNG